MLLNILPRRTVLVRALMLALVLMPGSAAVGGIPLDEFVVLVTTAEIEETKGGDEEALNDARLLAGVVDDLLPNYIDRAFERGFGRYVTVGRLPSWTDVFSDDLDVFKDKTGANALVVPRLSISAKGILLRADLYDLGQEGLDIDLARPHAQEPLMLAYSADYGQVSNELDRLAVRIATLIGTGEFARGVGANYGDALTPSPNQPNIPVSMFCISAVPADDQELANIAREVMLRLASHLNQAGKERGLSVEFDASDPMLAYFCPILAVAAQKADSDLQQFGFMSFEKSLTQVMSGSVARDDRGLPELRLSISSPGLAGGSFALPAQKVSGLEDADLDRLANDLIDSYARSPLASRQSGR